MYQVAKSYCKGKVLFCHAAVFYALLETHLPVQRWMNLRNLINIFVWFIDFLNFAKVIELIMFLWFCFFHWCQWSYFSPQAYSQPCQTSKMKFLWKIVDSFLSYLLFLYKSPISDVWQGFEYAFVLHMVVILEQMAFSKI